MDFTIDASTKTLHIDYINVSKIKVNYYLIDLEILFSKTPFISSVTLLFNHNNRMPKISASCNRSRRKKWHLKPT